MPSFISAGRNTRATFARKPHEINDKCKRKLRLCFAIFGLLTKMAFEMNDLKGILLLVLFAMPMISSANIDCRGKAFHCVNSTHFRICVDLGGGVSTTIDDFVIPCPFGTVCHEQNIFECDFPKIETTPPLDVIGVPILSDASVTNSVINSETASTLPSVISSKENVNVTTLRMLEEDAPESMSTIQVTATTTYSVIGEQTNQDTMVQSSIDKAVTASLTDILISNNPQSTTTFSDTTTEQYITKIVTESDKKIENVADQKKPKENIVDKVFDIIDEISTTPMVEMREKNQSLYTNSIHIQNEAEQIAIAEITTTDNVPEIRVDINTTPMVYTTQVNIDDSSNQTTPANQNLTVRNGTDEITTERILKTGTDINTTPTVNMYSQRISTQNSSVNHGIVERESTGEINTADQILETRPELNTTPLPHIFTQTFNINEIINETYSVNKNILEQNAIGGITTSEQLLETFVEITSTPTTNVKNQSLNINDTNNQTKPASEKIAAQISTGQIITSDQIPEIRTEINTTPTMNVQTQNLDIDDTTDKVSILNHNIADQNTTGETTTTEEILEPRSEISMTPAMNVQTQRPKTNQTNSIQSLPEHSTIGLITTTEQLLQPRFETSTTPTINVQTQIHDVNNKTKPKDEKIAEQISTGQIVTSDQLTEIRTEINTTPTTNVQIQRLNFDDATDQVSIINHDIADQITIGETTTTEEILEARSEISTTPAMNVQTQSPKTNQANSIYQTLAEHNTIGIITTTEQILEPRFEISTTPTINVQTSGFNILNVNNKTKPVDEVEHNSTGVITTFDQKPEARTDINTTSTITLQSQSLNIDNTSDQATAVNENLAEQNSTEDITEIKLILETRHETTTTPTINIHTHNYTVDDINNQSRLVTQNIGKENATDEITKTNQIIETRTEINSTPMPYLYTQKNLIDIENKQTNSVNQNVTASSTTDEFTTTDQTTETNANDMVSGIINPMPESITIVKIPQETTEKAYVSLATEGNMLHTTLNQSNGNDSIVAEKTNIANSLEKYATTDTPIIFVDKSNNINKSWMTENNAFEHNNIIDRLETVYDTSNSDLPLEKVTEATLLPTSIVDTIVGETLTTEAVYTTEKGINELPVTLAPLSVTHTNVIADNVINISTTPTPYNVTVISDTNITASDWTQILANTSVNITPEKFLGNTPYTSLNIGTNVRVRSYAVNKNEAVNNQHNGTEAINRAGKVNIDQPTEIVPGDIDLIVINSTNVDNTATTPYAPDTSETTISDVPLALQKSNSKNTINSIYQIYNSTHAPITETTQSEVSKTKLPQSPLLNQYITGITTQRSEVLHTTVSLDSVRNVPNYLYVTITDYKIEMSTSSPLDVTHDNNVEVVTDRVVSTSQEPTGKNTINQIINHIEEIDTSKQVNIPRVGTESLSDIASTLTTTQVVIIEKDSNLNTSNWNDLVNKDTQALTPDHNKGVIQTTIANLINGKYIETTTSHSGPVNDDSINIVAPFDRTDLPTNKPTNETPKRFILNNQINSTENNKTIPAIFDANVETTTSQDLSVSMSTTIYNATKVKESVITQLENTNTKAPIEDKYSVNVEDTRIVSPTEQDVEALSLLSSSSTIKYNGINLTRISIDETIPAEDTNTFITSKGLATDYTGLPDVGIEAVTAMNSYKDKNVSSNTPGSVGSSGGFAKTPATVTSSTQIISPLIMPEEVQSNSVQLITELPHFTTGVIETQTVYRDVPNYSPKILEVTQLVTEPVYRTLNSQTTLAPIIKTNSDVSSTFITTGMPLDEIATKNNFNPLSFTDTTTETVIISVTDPDSMVETIEVNQDKTTGTDHLSLSVNNSSNSEPEKHIDHANIVIEFASQNSTQGITNRNSTNTLHLKNRQDMILEIENNTMQTNTLTDSDKTTTFHIPDFSIDGRSTSTMKSDIDIENKEFTSDLRLAAQIDAKQTKVIDTVEHGLSTVTKSWSYVTSQHLVQKKNITNENANVNINNSVKTNIYLSDIRPNKVQVSSGNISHVDNKNIAKVNDTKSLGNLSQHDSEFSDNLDQHLSVNYTMTLDIQSHMNESDNRSNKTSNELKTRNISMYNLNTSADNKLNAKVGDNINAIVSPFDCTNHTRGKYADKNDCRKFYNCIGKLQPLVGICPNNTVFSEINKQCTRNLSHCVRNNQFRCLFEGRFNDFFNDNIYYICVKNNTTTFVRYKLQCLSNYHLNKVSVRCEKNIEIPSNSASSVSENSKINNEESTPEKKSKESKTNTSFEHLCEKEGQFPYAKDCNKYYTCTKVKDVYRRKIKKCGSEEVYDKEKKKCVEADSGEC